MGKERGRKRGQSKKGEEEQMGIAVVGSRDEADKKRQKIVTLRVATFSERGKKREGGGGGDASGGYRGREGSEGGGKGGGGGGREGGSGVGWSTVSETLTVSIGCT